MTVLNIEPANDDQREFIYSTKPEILFSSGAGGGKSYAGVLKVLQHNIRYPGGRALICRKEMSALRDSTIDTVHEILPKDMILYENKNRGIIKHKTNGSRESEIRFSGLETRKGQEYPTKIGSTKFSTIFVDEASELEVGDWEMLISRLRHNYDQYTDEFNDRIPRQLFAATNPDTPHHFLHDRFIKEEHRSREVMFTTPHENPYLPDGYIELMEESMTGIRKERMLEGKWVQAEGMVYDYDPRKHRDSDPVLDDLNDYQRLVFTADSNYPKPRACLLLGFTGEEVHVIDEYYQRRSHVEDLAEWITDTIEAYDIKKSRCEAYHDPSDPNAIDKLKRHTGLTWKKADNDIQPGIASVNKYFSSDDVAVHPRCSNFVDEITAYEYASDEEERPRKKDDHLMDALRYGIHTERPKDSTSVLSGLKT